MRGSDSSMTSNSIIDRWKYYIVAGNQCFLKKEFDAAACQYEFARQCAETIFDEWVNHCEAVSALVVTYHNIADLQRKIGNGNALLFYLERVHSRVLNKLLVTPISHKKHRALMGGSKRTYSALISYKKCGAYY